MSNKKPELYRWDRFTKPRVYSRSQQVTTTDDIQDWIKKVEDASGKAAAEAFGTRPAARRKPQTRAAAMATVEDMHMHDAAYSEAQDLLQHWVDSKLDFDTDPEYTEKGWEEQWQRKTQVDIKREWDHLLHPDESDPMASLDLEIEALSSARSQQPKKDPYEILDQDSDSLVGNILQGMLDKQVVQDSVVEDLGLDGSSKKQADPRVKMQMRHLQVKENREKRIQEKRRKLHDQQVKKDAHYQARQLVKKEEQDKVAQEKREEREIQKEMARLRKEMAEERKRKDEEKSRLKREQEELECQALEELGEQQKRERHEQWRTQRAAEDRERQIKRRMAQLEAREVTQNLRILQRCFSGWYDVVIERRLQAGKAKAMADWKLLLRTWNAWRSYTRSHRLDLEERRHLVNLQEAHRREAQAVSHYRLRQLHRCFTSWQVYVTQQQTKRELVETQSKTRNKMAAFLEAASTGKLWTGSQGQGQGHGHDLSLEDVESSVDTEGRVDELFSQPARVKGGSTCRSDSPSSTARSDRTPGRSARGKHQGAPGPPTDAWQVTRKHVEVTKGDLATLDEGQGEGQDSDRSTKKAKKPWERAPFVASNFENRHAAQQKILEVQQKQIQEQQRLIEEMQYLQRQQMLQQKLGQGSGVVTPNQGQGVTARGDMPKLQAHLENLQRDTVEEVENSEILTERSEATTVSALNTERSTPSAVTTARSTTSGAASDASSAATSKITAASDNSRHATFLKGMQDRAAQRNQLKKEREEKRRKTEEEKLARLEAEAEERRRQEEEEKLKRIDAHREKKRLEKQREIEKQRDLLRMKELQSKAEEHSRVAVMRFRGWHPWRRLTEMARERTHAAEVHYRNTVLKKCLLGWHDLVQSELEEKRALADKMHQYILVKRCFHNWRRLGEYTSIQEEKAKRFHQRRLLTRVLQTWAEQATEEKVTRWHHERIAREHDTVRIQKRALRAWMGFPQSLREERERERRREEMRRKVSSLIPDFDRSAPTSASVELL